MRDPLEVERLLEERKRKAAADKEGRS